MSPKGGTRKGAGRRPKPLAERRRNRVTVQFTDAEIEAIQELADADGGSPSLYIRDVVMAHVARRRRSTKKLRD